nr:dihydrolipoamide acetyltransferase, long form protein [Tanacetum cinerariifolium]
MLLAYYGRITPFWFGGFRIVMVLSPTERMEIAHHAFGDDICLCKSCIGSASSTPMFTRSYRAANTTKGQNGLAAKAEGTSVSGMVLSRGISLSFL